MGFCTLSLFLLWRYFSAVSISYTEKNKHFISLSPDPRVHLFSLRFLSDHTSLIWSVAIFLLVNWTTLYSTMGDWRATKPVLALVHCAFAISEKYFESEMWSNFLQFKCISLQCYYKLTTLTLITSLITTCFRLLFNSDKYCLIYFIN